MHTYIYLKCIFKNNRKNGKGKIKFIQKNCGFYKSQYGLQQQSNTLGAVVDVLQHISNKLDKNKYVVVRSFLIYKRLSTLDIKLLLNKMYGMGIRGVCYVYLNLIRRNEKNILYKWSRKWNYRNWCCRYTALSSRSSPVLTLQHSSKYVYPYNGKIFYVRWWHRINIVCRKR